MIRISRVFSEVGIGDETNCECIPMAFVLGWVYKPSPKINKKPSMTHTKLYGKGKLNWSRYFDINTKDRLIHRHTSR